jgi:hypothetical protein
VPVSFFNPFLASFWIGARVSFCFRSGEAAALDHEVRNHAMEHRAVEEAVLRILEEVLNRLGRLVLIQLDRQRALRGLDLELGIGGVRGDAEKKCKKASRNRRCMEPPELGMVGAGG